MKVLANVPLCSAVKCVALQMTVIKVLRDCGGVWVLSPSGACADLLLLIITVWLSMLGHEKACMAGQWHRASHGMFELCTSSYNQSFLNELQEDLIAACETTLWGAFWCTIFYCKNNVSYYHLKWRDIYKSFCISLKSHSQYGSVVLWNIALFVWVS